MAKARKHSNLFYARKILREVVRHSNNRDRRLRAVGRALTWQLYKRAVRRPLKIRAYGHSSIMLHPDSTSASNIVYFGLRFDAAEMRFMEKYLSAGDHFVDAGANIGAYTLLAAELVGPSGAVDAIEPHPVASARLRENVGLNHYHHVRVHDLALSDNTRGTSFLLDLDVSNRIAKDADCDRNQVHVGTGLLDDIVGDRTCAMVKLDIEGAELLALDGASGLLEAANPPVWLVEIIETQLERFGASGEAIIERFAEHGYRPLRFRGAKSAHPSANWLFAKEDSLAAVREILAAENLEAR